MCTQPHFSPIELPQPGFTFIPNWLSQFHIEKNILFVAFIVDYVDGNILTVRKKVENWSEIQLSTVPKSRIANANGLRLTCVNGKFTYVVWLSSKITWPEVISNSLLFFAVPSRVLNGSITRPRAPLYLDTSSWYSPEDSGISYCASEKENTPEWSSSRIITVATAGVLSCSLGKFFGILLRLPLILS